MNLIERLQDELTARGIPVSTLIADGRKHRIATPDKPHHKNGEYIIKEGYAAFRDYKSGANVCIKGGDVTAQRDERRIADRQVRAEIDRRIAERDRRQALHVCEGIWKQARPCQSHPYLTRKQVPSYGLRLHKGLLLIPYFDADGKLSTLQFIDKDGNKNFKKYCRYQGTLFEINPTGVESALMLACEGYATGATLFAAFGLPVIVCGVAGNVLPVLRTFRAAHPAARLTYYADNDRWTETPPNPGVAVCNAIKAAWRDVACRVPQFRDLTGEPTDFNDLMTREGLDAVRRYAPHTEV